MFGEGVFATDAFAISLSSPPVANCGGGELLVGGECRKWRIAAVANVRCEGGVLFLKKGRACICFWKKKKEEAGWLTD